MPPGDGTQPPQRPVAPPRGVTGMRSVGGGFEDHRDLERGDRLEDELGQAGDVAQGEFVVAVVDHRLGIGDGVFPADDPDQTFARFGVHAFARILAIRIGRHNTYYPIVASTLCPL